MPTFKPTSFTQLAKNFDEMSLEELKRHNAVSDFNNLIIASPERAAQLTFIDNLISFLRRSKKLDESEKAAILTGALLDVKKQIKVTYFLRSPENSYVYSQIDKVIGVKDDNKLDRVTKHHNQRAYVAFLMHEEYMKEVMKGVEKAELLRLNKHITSTVQASHVSTATAVLKKLQSGSKHHVELSEKALDTTHMGFKKSKKVESSNPKHTKFSDKEYTRHYIATENISEEERAIRFARYGIHMRTMYKVHNEVLAFDQSSLHTPIIYDTYYHQPTLTATNRIEGQKNYRISDVEDMSYHFDEYDDASRARRQEIKERDLHPSIRLFDKSKLKHVEPKPEVVQEQVATLRK